MDNIIVITQNVIIDSLYKIKSELTEGKILLVSTQYIFDNEKQQIESILGQDISYINFSDLMSDEELEQCDVDAFNLKGQRTNLQEYYDDIRELKNKRIIEKISKQYSATRKIIVCDDLGLHLQSWLAAGYKKVECEYYHNKAKYTPLAIPECSALRKILRKIKYRLYTQHKERLAYCMERPISVAKFNNKKYIFFGSLNRIGYRLNIEFKPAGKWEHIRYFLDNYYLNTQPNSVRLSTLHETDFKVRDSESQNYKLLQDGYLPPNYTSKYLLFYGSNTEFYTWDEMGLRTFKYHNLPCRIIPFRKKLYLPQPNHVSKVKKVLCVASGAGDWTALKNRSDEDKMVVAFGKIAAMFPEIEFVYRCHPVWIHPVHQGVDSINRVAEYINWLNLPNLKMSSNIPCANNGNKFQLSFKRSSFEEDLRDVDVVFGEHSISMIDAAFKGMLFCSVNVTGRRDLFCGITEMGFPHCESVEEIATFLRNVTNKDFSAIYIKAVNNYNKMTDKN